MDGYAREADLRELKARVEATLPHLATKADVSTATNKIYAAIAIAVLSIFLKDLLIKLFGS